VVCSWFAVVLHYFTTLRQQVYRAAGMIYALLQSRSDVEICETVLDYVPLHSSCKGGLFFSQDPRKSPLQLRAKGYAES